MKIALIGCGYIGSKRAKQIGHNELVGVFDTNVDRANKLANELATNSYSDPQDLLRKSDIALICTTNNALAPSTLLALQNDCHVLVEKPGSVSLAEIRSIRQLAEKNSKKVKVGFNHRFHPAILKMRELVDSGALGPLMFLRARYGHGARLDYDKEWRCDPALSGGGELMDQGVHLLDLIYWFFGPLPLHSSMVKTSYWPMKVDDNAVLNLGATGKNQPWATFHVSCSEWKNNFSLELYGRTGKVLITGLGGSYGPETLTYYRMLPQMGPPEIENFSFDTSDKSWELDLHNLISSIEQGSPLWGDLNSAEFSITRVLQAYENNGY